MREDSSVLPLSLNCIMDHTKLWTEKINISSYQWDNVSVDRMKPVFSNEKVYPALPLPHGRPPRHPPPSAANPLPPAANTPPPVRIKNKSVSFSLPSHPNLP